MKRAKCFLPILFLGCSIFSYALETTDFTIHLEIKKLKEAKTPYFLAGNLILTYESDRPARFVGAAFKHEMRTDVVLHPYVRNEHGIFVLVYPIDRDIEVETLQYRIIVDGLWMPDPLNPKIERDRNSIPLSVISIPKRLTETTSSPTVLPNGKVKFLYKGPENRSVYILGDFNNWDPFMHKLHKTEEPGTYTIELRLLPGDHYYYFLSNGLRVLDPLNPERAVDYEGFDVSRFTVPEPEQEG